MPKNTLYILVTTEFKWKYIFHALLVLYVKLPFRFFFSSLRCDVSDRSEVAVRLGIKTESNHRNKRFKTVTIKVVNI